MISFVFLIIQILFALFTLFLVIAFFTGAPFVPSKKKTAESMIALAHLQPGMKVYDLGSGEGRLLELAAQRGATCVGFEINPFLVLFSRIKILFSPYRARIKVEWKNFWSTNVSDADVIFVYLLPWRMEKLEAFLKDHLKSGALVVSNSFIFPDWKIHSQDRKNHVYVFRVAAA